MRSGYARHQGETGQRQVGDTGGLVRTIDRDIRIAAAGREAEILRSADIIGTPAVRQAEDAAVIGLAFILERQRLIGVGRAVERSIPAPQVHASGNTTDGETVAVPWRATRSPGSTPRTMNARGLSPVGTGANCGRHRLWFGLKGALPGPTNGGIASAIPRLLGQLRSLAVA